MTLSRVDLLDETARLVAIPSVSGAEGAIAQYVWTALSASPHLDVVRIGDNVIARTTNDRPMRALLAGHLDTVPPAGNGTATVDGERLSGVGSADMKGGLAVMLDLARSLESPQIDCTYVFYAREEVARAESGLIEVQTSRPDLLACDVAIVLEPTNAIIEAGCQGVVRVEVCVRGVRAHSARPWVGTNAIHRMGKVLDLVSGFPEREPEIDGVTYHETLQAVGVEGGVAGNVIPDLARLTLSHRFAPDRTTDDAIDALVGYLAPVIDPDLGDTITVIDRAPAAPPGLGHPVIAALIDASGAAPVAKTAWTDVARFAERGTPAANFGPGDPLVAHSAGEFVVAEEIARVADALRAVLG